MVDFAGGGEKDLQGGTNTNTTPGTGGGGSSDVLESPVDKFMEGNIPSGTNPKGMAKPSGGGYDPVDKGNY